MSEKQRKTVTVLVRDFRFESGSKWFSWTYQANDDGTFEAIQLRRIAAPNLLTRLQRWVKRLDPPELAALPAYYFASPSLPYTPCRPSDLMDAGDKPNRSFHVIASLPVIAAHVGTLHGDLKVAMDVLPTLGATAAAAEYAKATPGGSDKVRPIR